MKKEKTIKTYQRRTKTGKVVVVKQHTAKYDAAEDLKKALKKKGAGEELDALKKSKYEVLGVDLSDMSDEDFKAFAGGFLDEDDNPAPTTRAAFKKWMEKQPTGVEGRAIFKESVAEFMKDGGAKGLSSYVPKKSSSKASSTPTTAGFTADEYRQWYHWDVDSDPKNKAALKVEKALKAQMGAKGYKKYFDECTDSYSARGHNKAYKSLTESSANTSEYGSVPKHLGISQDDWNTWMDGSGKGSLRKADKAATEHLTKLYGKDGARYIRQKYESDGSNRYIDLVSSNKADKEILSEVSAYTDRKNNYNGPKRVDVGSKVYFVSADGIVTDSRGRKVSSKVSASVLASNKGGTSKGALSKSEIEDLETPIRDIRKAAKALGVSERVAASWMEGPNWSNYSEKDLKAGDRAAKKYLGAEAYKKLDPTSADIPMAVLRKIKEGPAVERKDFDNLKETKRATGKAVVSTTQEKSRTWTAASIKGLTKESFRKLSEGDRTSLNEYMKDKYKSQKFDLGHPYAYYTVGGFSVTNEHAVTAESNKKLAVKLIPHTSFGDPGSPRYASLEMLKKLKKYKQQY